MSNQLGRVVDFIGLMRDLDNLLCDVSGKPMTGHATKWWREHGRPFLEHLEKGRSPHPLEEEYSFLGLAPTASDEVVRAAFIALMKQHHPDTGGGNEEMAKQVNAAYEKLAKARGMK